MTTAIDELMQTASEALAGLDYAQCESLCLEALSRARDAGDWRMLRRVLLPLQEARRQKRQAAIDGLILLGTNQRTAQVHDLIADERCGCIVLTHPHSRDDAAALDAITRETRRPIEVLYCDNPAGADRWAVTTCRGPAVRTELPAPDPAWIGRWVDPLATTPPTPAHWFMRASEALGHAAIDAINAPACSIERYDRLAAALSAVGDHEILHQRLADAARDLHEAGR